ncbi:lysophospholipase [Acetobacteraceae bacterium KSS8]|uniref:Lysophospholipase n=1 Tax=Endosaccharibacter trunci TaxID=2812733 RepID=A0ABT1W5T1_9PROT|nr:lysophospholipase [Acetobacteraceae bacterium KSS8]
MRSRFRPMPSRLSAASPTRLLRLLAVPMLLLSACATQTAPPAPPRAHLADRRLVPPDTVFTLSDGARLPARIWRAAGPERAVVLALHGFNDSRDAWELPAPVLAAQGITVFAPDQRGFGGAPDRGRWAGTDRMVRDAAELARQIEAREPGVPLFVMGESMGGAIALCLAASPERPPVAGFILLAPAVWSRKEMNPALTASLWLAATFAPDWHLTGRHLPLRIQATDNRDALYRLAYDPLTVHETRAATLRGLVNLMTRAQDDAPRATGRILVAYGGHDQLVPPRATAATWDALPPGVRRSFYPAGYHLLLRDRDRDRPLADLVSFMLEPDRPLPSGGDVAAAGWRAGESWDAEPPLFLPGALDSLAGR